MRAAVPVTLPLYLRRHMRHGKAAHSDRSAFSDTASLYWFADCRPDQAQRRSGSVLFDTDSATHPLPELRRCRSLVRPTCWNHHNRFVNLLGLSARLCLIGKDFPMGKHVDTPIELQAVVRDAIGRLSPKVAATWAYVFDGNSVKIGCDQFVKPTACRFGHGGQIGSVPF